jgi:VIT1/CCC1 family predicted Fe2+/Mn2+ transporter
VPRSAIHVSHSILVGPYPCRLDGALGPSYSSSPFRARPIQAALASAASFAVGATVPLLVTAAAPRAGLIPLVAGSSLVFLALLGGLAARVGGAGVAIGAIRVTFWGALAMVVTAGIEWLFGTIV